MNASPTSPTLLLPGTRTGRDPERSIPRGPRRTSAEAVAATQRDRLLDGIVRTVADKGFARARVSDICQAAGVTRPVFYELFDGKEDAFLAAHRHGTGLLLQAVEASFARAADWPAGVVGGLSTLLGILADAPAFAAMAIVEIDAVGPAGREERRRLLAAFHRFFSAAPATDAPVPRSELVDCVVGGVYSTIYRWVDADRTRELPALLPTVCYTVLAPFLGPAAAAAALDEARAALPVTPACTAPADRRAFHAPSSPVVHK